MTQAPIVTVSTWVQTHEKGEKCLEAVQRIFPDFLVTEVPTSGEFPIQRDVVELSCEGLSPDRFLELLGEQRILDTALDAMSLNIHENTTTFLISRQAALSGKVAFVLETERTVGGVIEVSLICNDMVDWLQEATWHSGRVDVPRSVGDELSMYRDGAVSEWFDKNGRPTIQSDD